MDGLNEEDERFRKKNGKKARKICAFMLCASSRAWRLYLQLAFASTSSGRQVMADEGRYSLARDQGAFGLSKFGRIRP